MPVLMIGEAERAKIAELIAFAQANVVDPQAALALSGTALTAYRDMMMMMSLKLPVGYWVTYSHERQPSIGVCHHISVSVERKHRAPSMEAVEMIIEAFGMQPLASLRQGNGENGALWVEEVEPGIKAVNIVQPVMVVP